MKFFKIKTNTLETCKYINGKPRIITICILLAMGLMTCIFGLKTSPDSFAYIDGAKNILHYHSYNYDANGLPITLFPPGYSIIIASLFSIFGYYVYPLILLNTTIFIVLIFKYIKYNNYANNYLFFSVLCILTNILISNYSMILSETIFIPLFLIWFNISIRQNNNVKYKFLILFLEILMISTRYASILLIFSFYTIQFYYIIRTPNKINYKFQKVLQTFWIPAISLLFFVLLRKIISNGGPQHHFVIGSGKYNILEYPIQLIKDIGTTILGQASSFQLEQRGLLFLISCVMIIAIRKFVKITIDTFTFNFILISILVTIIFLSNVWVDDSMNGRYLVWLWITLLYRAKFEIRKNEAYTKIFFICIILTQLINLNYFNYKAVKSNFAIQNTVTEKNKINFSNQIPQNTSLKVGIYYTDSTNFGTLSNNGNGKLLLTSPCYLWNLIQKNDTNQRPQSKTLD